VILPGALGAAIALRLLEGEGLLPLVGWIAAALIFFETGLLRLLRRLRARRSLDADLRAETDRILARVEAQAASPQAFALDALSLVGLALLLPPEPALLLAAAAVARAVLPRLP
jgi:hypothetical protein